MKARRTPWWYYVLAVALGLLAGIGLAKYGEISGLPLVGAPWIVPVILAVLGLAVLYRALQIDRLGEQGDENAHRLIDHTCAADDDQQNVKYTQQYH